VSTKMTEYIVFLSGKVNTGKTSLSVNVASLLASKGYLVALIDMDFHNPSLYNYFSGEKIERKVSLNDYILGSDNPDLIVELTPVLEKYSLGMKTGGDLFCVFAKAADEKITRMEHSELEKLTSVRRLIRLISCDIFDREFTVNKNREYLGNPDFVILDLDINSMFWFTNGLSLIDTVFTTQPSRKLATHNDVQYFQILDVFESHGKKIESLPAIPFHKDLYPREFLTVLRCPRHEYSRYINSITSQALENRINY
jgi:cellulose biosynthesis protein BcsQ